MPNLAIVPEGNFEQERIAEFERRLGRLTMELEVVGNAWTYRQRSTQDGYISAEWIGASSQ